MRNYRNYTDNDIIQNTKQVKSLAALLKSLGLKAVGSNYANMKRLLQKLNVDCSHWTGQGWNKNKQLKDWSDYSKIGSIKKNLIKIRGHKCENKECNRTHWLGELIKLEIHHIDNDRTNNSPDNLQLICPNCHSLTKGFRNRRNNPMTKEEKDKYYYNKCECGENKRRTSKVCIVCSKKLNKLKENNTKIPWPQKDKLHYFVWNYTMKNLSKILLVSDVSIKKRCKKLNIKTPSDGYWQKLKVGKIVDYQI